MLSVKYFLLSVPTSLYIYVYIYIIHTYILYTEIQLKKYTPRSNFFQKLLTFHVGKSSPYRPRCGKLYLNVIVKIASYVANIKKRKRNIEESRSNVLKQDTLREWNGKKFKEEQREYRLISTPNNSSYAARRRFSASGMQQPMHFKGGVIFNAV